MSCDQTASASIVPCCAPSCGEETMGENRTCSSWQMNLHPGSVHYADLVELSPVPGLSNAALTSAFLADTGAVGTS